MRKQRELGKSSPFPSDESPGNCATSSTTAPNPPCEDTAELSCQVPRFQQEAHNKRDGDCPWSACSVFGAERDVLQQSDHTGHRVVELVISNVGGTRCRKEYAAKVAAQLLNATDRQPRAAEPDLYSGPTLRVIFCKAFLERIRDTHRQAKVPDG